jgi:uncharacterized protein (TIGR03066 family)
MSKQIILILFMILPLFGMAQKTDSTIDQHQLLGVWQVKTSKLGDALQDHYQFFANGEFVYNFSQYDDTRRVLALKGKYRLTGNKLFMSVQSRIEITGGYFTKGSPGFQTSPFVLEGGTIETFQQVDTTNQHDPFFISGIMTGKTGKIIGLQIDNYKYYKISDNPNAFNRPTSIKREN